MDTLCTGPQLRFRTQASNTALRSNPSCNELAVVLPAKIISDLTNADSLSCTTVAVQCRTLEETVWLEPEISPPLNRALPAKRGH